MKKRLYFTLNLPTFQKDNCFITNLYFVYDNGLFITTEYADLWTDTILPDTNMIDISSHFPGIVGSIIINFTYDHKDIAKGSTHYGQPVTFLEMDSGYRLKLSTIFGEVPEEKDSAYFELLKK